MKQKKGKKILKGLLIGLGLGIVTLFTLLMIFIYFFFLGGPTKNTKDPKNYEKIFEERGVRTGYMVFPETIPEGAQDVTYYHSYQDTLFSPTVQTFLQCTYDAKTYEKEVERLEHTSKTYGNRKCVLLRDTEQKYQYPAYIAVENAASSYEYALLTGENQITYIFTMYGSLTNVKFDRKYLPKDYMKDAGKEYGSGYSIYYVSVSSAAIQTDYSREPVPEVRDSHSRMLGEDIFFVQVRLDSEGREMITECIFDDYEDISSDEMVETTYTELAGYEYVSVEVGKNFKTVTVSYKDGEEIKEKTYEVKK